MSGEHSKSSSAERDLAEGEAVFRTESLTSPGLPFGPLVRSVGYGRSFFAEIFSWKDQNSLEVAHKMPVVVAVWEPMGALCDVMEFIETEPVQMPFANG